MQPIRFAGSSSGYSANATPQLTKAAMNHGRPFMTFKWAHQANVMNTSEQISRSVAWSRTGMA